MLIYILMCKQQDKIKRNLIAKFFWSSEKQEESKLYTLNHYLRFMHFNNFIY